ncbi:histidine utilization repressor [Brenneria populi subsp. brevivirga]|uniref:histidine utilization repressor n=1 Tax=Brenneria populi TaxID=1505588 RepID=UPI002E16D8B9|nr:histidine utilization repressor [Brenneria populi subsp. brevivirga]
MEPPHADYHPAAQCRINCRRHKRLSRRRIRRDEARAMTGQGDNAPRYLQIKGAIQHEIAQGGLLPGDKVASENELVAAFGVSRMTANRALRELMFEGVLTRVAGVGTFVSPQRLDVDLLKIRNISDEIRERGNRYSAHVVVACRISADRRVAEALEMSQGDEVLHSLIVHHEDEQPMQLEERYVNPAAAPGYLTNDFTVITPNQYLTEIAPITAFEHAIEAVKPDPEVRRHLRLKADHPCLRVFRRTWSGTPVVSCALLYYPGMKYRFEARSGEGSVKPMALLGENRS